MREDKTGGGTPTTLAELLNAALEATKETVANLNEALAPKNGEPSTEEEATPAGPPPSCPNEGKSA
jgi:hypothetical protein